MDAVDSLKDQIELFLLAHPKTVLHDPRVGLIQLNEACFCLEIQYEKLFLTVWNSEQSITRRICKAKEVQKDRLILQVSLGSSPSFEIEFDARVSRRILLEKKAARQRFARQMRRWLQIQFPHIRIERLTTAKDLSRSYSEHFCRGVALDRNLRWALLGVNPCEDQTAVDACLSFALIWVNDLRAAEPRPPVCGLKLLVPQGRSASLSTRIGYFRLEALQIDLLEYSGEVSELIRIDPADYGNLDTRLSRVDRVPLPLEKIPMDFLPGPIRSHRDCFEIVHRPASRHFSIRFRGLEFARLAEERLPRVSFGIGPMDEEYHNERADELLHLIESLQKFRCADSPMLDHPYYRLQSERWLESLVLSDIRQIRFDLDPNFVYPQVPAFSGVDRGVIDILTLTRDRRLAVVELKVSEDINLPLQALDYWTRVKWHHERGDLERQGYFLGMNVSKKPPILFLVCPAFRFHSTTEGMLKFFPREIEVVKVGINEDWRKGIQVLYRRES